MNKQNTLAWSLQERLIDGIWTGHDWSNTQDELTRLQCAKEMRRLVTQNEALLNALQSIGECCEENQNARDYASRQVEIRGIARLAIQEAKGSE